MPRRVPGPKEEERHVAQAGTQRWPAVKPVGAQMRARNGGSLKSPSSGAVRSTVTMATIDELNRYEALGKLLSLYLSFFVQ